MNRKPEDIRTAIDTTLSGASHDPTLYNRVVNASKGDSPPMRNKLKLTLVLTAVLVLMTTTALAVTLAIPSIQDFIDRDEIRKREYDYEPFHIDVNAVVKPSNQRHTSQLVNIEIEEAYLTTEAFYVTAHITPRSKNTVLFTHTLTSIIKDGQELRYFDLYKDESLTLLYVSGFKLDSPYPDSDYTLELDYTDVYRAPEEDGITFMMAFKVPEDLVYIFSGSTLMGKFVVDNARTGDWEFNAIYFDIPKLTRVEAHDSVLRP